MLATHRQLLVAELARSIGCATWDPAANAHACYGVNRARAHRLLSSQPLRFAIETPDAAGGGTLAHVVAVLYHAVVTLVVQIPVQGDDPSDAQVEVMIEDHTGDPSEDIIAAYQAELERVAKSAAERQLAWLRDLEPQQVAAGIRTIFGIAGARNIGRLLAPPARAA